MAALEGWRAAICGHQRPQFDILIDSVEGCEKRLEAQYTSMDMWQDGFIKEYRFVGYGHPAETAPNPEPAASSLKAGDWIESHGKVPNVSHGSKLMVRLRGGTDTGIPTWWHDDDDPGWWAHNDSKLDIIAYRLVNP